jgi:hypothetical protein
MQAAKIFFGGIWFASAVMIVVTLLLIVTGAPFIGNWNMAILWVLFDGIGMGAAQWLTSRGYL